MQLKKKKPRTTCALAGAVVLALLIGFAPAAAAQDTLIAQGADWKYLDDGSDQGTAWRAVTFDDSTWASGPAELGYGDGDEATEVSYGSSSSSKHITTYFRHSFTVADASTYSGLLSLRLIRDDGAVVYLNGTEVFRSNMPSGAIAYDTEAAGSTGGTEDEFQEATVDAGLLQDGTNVVAVEMHQSSGSSSDISFDLELLGPAPPPGPMPDPGPLPEGTLVATGSLWKYLDNGTDPGPAWRNLDFDDDLWPFGPAQLGYGDGDEATVVSYGSSSSSKHITTYFRHYFDVEDAAAFTGLKLRLLRDDGAVVYLNGTEVFRSNMPSGTITYLTLASGSGGSETQFYETGVDPALLSTGRNILAVEVHQNSGSSSDLSLDLELLDDPAAPPPPPPPPPPPDPDPDPGPDPEPAPGEPLIAAGATWRYLDDGSDQGTAWRGVTFDAGTWASGPAELGYGDGDEATVVSYGSSSSSKHITTYFRYRFSLADASIYEGLKLRLIRDDGAVVYLNGMEVFRSNMPSGVIDYDTESAGGTGGTEDEWQETTVDPGLLQDGLNVVAVEIHQSSGSSSDISFDLELLDNPPPPPPPPPGPPPEPAPGEALIAAGATWRYLDDGSDQGTAWRAVAFNDGAWASGPAELGYGDGDEATVVSYGSSSRSKHITTYFRYAFTLSDPDYKSLTLGLIRDDGGVVYLNGSEVFRSNMPSGVIDYDTEAAGGAGGTEDEFQETSVDPSLLQDGLNVVAVEIHQRSGRSSDISFDLRLEGSDTVPSFNFLPRGPYLQTASPTAITIRWRSDSATNSRVRYGTAVDALDTVVDDTKVTTEHEVRLTGLSSATKYWYSVGSTTQTFAGGGDCFFVTPPVVGTEQATRIWVIGDSGTADSAARRVRDAYKAFTQSRVADVWLMLGDNAYYSGKDDDYQDAVFETYPALLKNTPVWPTIGNHDESPAYFDIFTLPASAEAGGVASGTENYYSFDYANIHFVCLDSEKSDTSPSGAMASWLKNDLGATAQKWIIAYWHHPPYSKGSHDSDAEGQLERMRENFVPILEAHGVDLVLTGHSHSYERSYLIDGHYGESDTLTTAMILDGGNGRENGTGAYVKPDTVGAANEGAVYAVCGCSGKTSSGDFDHPAMFIGLRQLGSMVLDISGNRLDARFLRDTGAVDDIFTILKE